MCVLGVREQVSGGPPPLPDPICAGGKAPQDGEDRQLARLTLNRELQPSPGLHRLSALPGLGFTRCLPLPQGVSVSSGTASVRAEPGGGCLRMTQELSVQSFGEESNHAVGDSALRVSVGAGPAPEALPGIAGTTPQSKGRSGIQKHVARSPSSLRPLGGREAPPGTLREPAAAAVGVGQRRLPYL
ncbi:hypothetical protein MG293_004129 [Ovis ammon polii]|uniref:Uncharacterized protein n=1 Tax=Ovis ammon polii TaxID=230172 RepID=A0AAD4UMP3_OVIAM|nr:hypothetical protein MG293_004129 [Ovis ammon polii]